VTNENPTSAETAQIAQLLSQVVAQLRIINLKLDEIIARADGLRPRVEEP
jgi:hypothetical protein